MSATSIQVVTASIPNPDDPGRSGEFQRVNASISFTYLSSFDIRTLSTTATSTGDDINGLLYVPDLATGDPCINASAPFVPQNVTRRANLPDTDLTDLIAIAPWLSPMCVQNYLSAGRHDMIKTFLFFLPNNDTTEPPEDDDSVWSIGDNGAWKTSNQYPVYAVPGNAGSILMHASAEYSQNMTDVPHGHALTEIFDPRDYVRLFVNINTGGTNSLPSLWIFLLVVLGILLVIIGSTSLMMHWLQRRRRQNLRRRVASGEVDLEALGIKRLTVPQELLDQMPLYTYGSGAPVAPAQGVPSVARQDVSTGKSVSEEESRTPSPLPNPTPAPVLARSTSYRPTPLQQPTCAICLDDFVPASSDGPGTIVRELPCHHIFHPECVDTFLRDNSSLCPMCKKTALPKGYCPRVVTNAMVRRERMVRRIRPEASEQEDGGESGEGIAPLGIGSRIRTRTFSSLSQLRPGRRVSSAPTPSTQAMTEMSPTAPAPALTVERSNTTASAAAPQSNPQVQPPSNPRRREWARQRAVAMLGRQAPVDPDAEEARTTPRWRKAIRGIFPVPGR